MNTFVKRFATRGASAEFSRENVDDDDCLDYAWGSQAGFGSLAKGGPSFLLPNVLKVCSCRKYEEPKPDITLPAALEILADLYRRGRSKLQDQARAWDHDIGVQVPGWCDSRSGLSSICRELHWCASGLCVQLCSLLMASRPTLPEAALPRVGAPYW